MKMVSRNECGLVLGAVGCVGLYLDGNSRFVVTFLFTFFFFFPSFPLLLVLCFVHAR